MATATITHMSQINIASSGNNLILSINGSEVLSVAKSQNQAIYMYVVAMRSCYVVTYSQSNTAPPADDSSYVRFIPKTKNGSGGYNELSINGNTQIDTLIIQAYDDIRYSGIEKFNVTNAAYEVYIWFATKSFPDSTTRDVAKVKITTPASAAAEANCNNLPNQSFCHCSDC